jgi:hypothetical protein
MRRLLRQSRGTPGQLAPTDIVPRRPEFERRAVREPLTHSGAAPCGVMKPPPLMQEVHSQERKTPTGNMKPELKPHIGLK